MIRTRKWKWLLWLLWIVQYAAEAACMIRIWELSMLPIDYYFALLAVMIVLLLLAGKLLFLRKGYVKSGKNARMCAGGSALAVMTILLCVAAIWFSFEEYPAAQNLPTLEENSSAAVTILVRTADPAQSLDDTVDYVFACVGDSAEGENGEAMAYLESRLGKSIVPESYESTEELIQALYDGAVDAVILDAADAQPLSEKLDNFDSETKMLKRIPVSDHGKAPDAAA